MRTILAAIALVASLLCTSCEAKPPFAKFEKYTGRLEMPDGSTCSGTRFGTAILSTRHCFEGPSKQVRFQGILVNILRVWIDGENIWVHNQKQAN